MAAQCALSVCRIVLEWWGFKERTSRTEGYRLSAAALSSAAEAATRLLSLKRLNTSSLLTPHSSLPS
jgi:hypothetical protein